MASLDPAIPQAEPNQDVASKPLDDRHAFTPLPPMRRMRSHRALGKAVQYLVDQGETLLNLAHADPDARVDITLIQDGYLNALAVIRRIGKGPARVEASAGGAADVAAGGILFGQCRFEHAGIDGAILQ
jgi:hypothetical protein